VALFLLIIISVAATYWSINAQRRDALVINLAGRQRMLAQKMVWLALSRPDDPELTSTIEQFDQTLSALRNGGMVQYPSDRADSHANEIQTVFLPSAPDAELRSELDKIADEWASVRNRLKPLDEAGLQAQAPTLVAMLDSVVSQYERRAGAKLVRVQIIQGTTLVAGLALLSWGFVLTRKRIVYPLNSLRSAASCMAQGDLLQPIPRLGQDELGEVGKALDCMRTEVMAARGNLEGRVAQRTRELVSAFEFSQEIVAEHDLGHLLQSVVDRTRALTQADAAALCLLESEPTALILVAGSDSNPEIVGTRQPLENDPAYRVIRAGQTVTVPAECTRCAFLLAHAPSTSAVAPLHSGDTTLGALCVVRPPTQAFDEEETRALTLLANTATVAIANARLIGLGRRQAERAAIHSERERLAGELHDNLAQTLGFINLKIDQLRLMIKAGKFEDSLAELNTVKSAIGGAYGQVRAALVGLSEPVMEPGGYLERLSESVAEFGQVTGADIHLDTDGVKEISISPLAQNQSLHIIREALTNANRHSGAKNIWVKVLQDTRQATITIEDDGYGFDPDSVLSRDHLGLHLMRERAERSCGALTVESTPGKGTRVSVSFPTEVMN